jgi:hypothetical protein
MVAKNTTETTLSATYVINPTKGNVKVVVTTKKEAEKETSAKPVANFAPNKRYSINSIGGGYTGL